MKVSEILQRKGSKVWTIGPDDTVLAALELMAEKRIGALVVAEEDVPIGVFSERDYARKVALESRSSKRTPVRERCSHGTRSPRRRTDAEPTPRFEDTREGGRSKAPFPTIVDHRRYRTCASAHAADERGAWVTT